MDKKRIIMLALASRFIMFGISYYMDNYCKTTFTDLDYSVFTDGAKYVSMGQSPYERHTYRYTPLLSYMMLPNILWSPLFGKVFFIFLEFLSAVLICAMTKKQPQKYQIIGLAIWFFNPATITLAVRGSADIITAFLLFLTLFLIKKRLVILPAIVYGLAVHFRIYPLFFCLCIYLHYAERKGKFLNKDSIIFGLVALSVVASLTALFFHKYGMQFLHDSYLYHISRKDHRHNFSIHFMNMYLSFEDIAPLESILYLLP